MRVLLFVLLGAALGLSVALTAASIMPTFHPARALLFFVAACLTALSIAVNVR